MYCAMSINWNACSAVATVVATLVALFLAVYNIRQDVKNKHNTAVDKAFEIALRLVDVVGDFYTADTRLKQSMLSTNGRYLIKLLETYGYSCDEDKVFNENHNSHVSSKELDGLFEHIKKNDKGPDIFARPLQ